MDCRMQVLNVRIAKTEQNVDLILVEELWGQVSEENLGVRIEKTEKVAVLRYRIRSNPHSHQSHALSERWNGNAWREVHTISPGGMATKTGLFREVGHSDLRSINFIDKFQTDLEELQETTYQILGFVEVERRP